MKWVLRWCVFGRLFAAGGASAARAAVAGRSAGAAAVTLHFDGLGWLVVKIGFCV